MIKDAQQLSLDNGLAVEIPVGAASLSQILSAVVVVCEGSEVCPTSCDYFLLH